MSETMDLTYLSFAFCSRYWNLSLRRNDWLVRQKQEKKKVLDTYDLGRDFCCDDCWIGVFRVRGIG